MAVDSLHALGLRVVKHSTGVEVNSHSVGVGGKAAAAMQLPPVPPRRRHTHINSFGSRKPARHAAQMYDDLIDHASSTCKLKNADVSEDAEVDEIQSREESKTRADGECRDYGICLISVGAALRFNILLEERWERQQWFGVFLSESRDYTLFNCAKAALKLHGIYYEHHDCLNAKMF